MNSIQEAKINQYLRSQLKVDFYDCPKVLKKLRELARAAGHALDDRFAQSGLGSGPEGRIASSIVDRSLGGGGSGTAEHDLRLAIERWIRA